MCSETDATEGSRVLLFGRGISVFNRNNEEESLIPSEAIAESNGSASGSVDEASVGVRMKVNEHGHF